MTEEQIQDLSYKIITAVSGKDSEENMNGVADILTNMIRSVNDGWEEYLLKTTDDTILNSNLSCEDCGCPINFRRSSKKLKVRYGVNTGIQ